MRTLIILLVGLLTVSSAEDIERARVIRDYHEIYLANLISRDELGWTGSVNTCRPGKINDEVYDKVFAQINYFRALVGVPPIDGLDEEWNEKSQHAALLMTARGRLNHHPGKLGKCYSEEAAEAASRSNLGWGVPNIAGYIHDWGVGNEAVGHRRWVLNPRATVFGVGATDRNNALWVIGKSREMPDGFEYQTYPAAGFFPKELVYPRWSFGMQAEFQNARVRMKLANGRSIPVKVLASACCMGLPTLVWEPQMDRIDLEGAQDVEVSVRIDGVLVDGKSRSFAYTTKLISAGRPG